MAKGYSLHIGLNSVDPAHYSGWSGPLVACEADVRSMERICRSRGFATEQLLTKAATRDAVIKGIRNAAKTLKKGDIFCLSYSGHGGQLPDLNGDEDDSLDETWCLYDGEMLDDELHRLYAEFEKGVRVLVFSDSCHSGTVTRMMMRAGTASVSSSGAISAAGPAAAQPAYRIMPPEAQLRTYEDNQAMYDKLLQQKAPPAKPKATVLLVSGCQDNQLSMDGPFNGAFTGALVASWRNGKFRGSYKELAKAIRSRLPSTQSPNYYVVGGINLKFETEQAFTV